jgi:hypothetical protein
MKQFFHEWPPLRENGVEVERNNILSILLHSIYYYLKLRTIANKKFKYHEFFFIAINKL